MLAAPLTLKQSEVLDFVRAAIRNKGVAPTLDEIADHFGTAKITVHEHLTHLQDKGRILRQPFKSRAITVIEPTDEALRDWIREAIAKLLTHGEAETARRGRGILGRIS